MSAHAAGKCRFCGCTEANACRTPPSGEPCGWFDAARTLCTNPRCVTAYFAARSKAAVEAWRNRPRKRTPADIYRLKLEEKRAKRRAARERRKGRVA